MFIGRTDELKELKRHLSGDAMRAILVYGRRRIGKTKLIQKALEKQDGLIISYTFRDVPTAVNVQEFSAYLASVFGEEYLSFNNLGAALEYLCQKAKEQKITLFLDEYSFLRRNDAGIDSYFQTAINVHEFDAKIKWIICGSYMDIMEKVIEQSAPLYGRFSYILLLHPFNYYESSLFLPRDLDSDGKFRYYAIFGGIGFTLTNIDPNLSFEENLKTLLIAPSSLLERQCEAIIQQEISKVPEAKFIFELIGKGVHKYGDLNARLAQVSDTKNIAYLLGKLLEMDLIAKVSTVNENAAKGEQYYIKDNLLDFYYSYLFPATAARNNMSADAFYESILPSLEKDYFPRKFEDVSREFLVRLNKNGRINPPFEDVGRYIYHDKANRKNGEFDVVTRNKRDYIDFECKYHKEKLSLADYQAEEKSVKSLKLPFKAIGFISRAGYKENFPKAIPHYELEQFYE